MSKNDDFFEVNNEVPYKNIKSINIDTITYQNNAYNITCKVKLEEGSGDPQSIKLVRQESDVTWLLDIFSNSEKCPLVPVIDASGAIENLMSYVSKQQPARIKHMKRLKLKLIQRSIKIISTVLLEFSKNQGETLRLPIFIFFHPNCALYQNPIYFKQESKSLTQKVGTYFWEKYTLLTSKNGIWDSLQKVIDSIFMEKQRISPLNDQLCEYISSLQKLQFQFLSQKDSIKRRLQVLSELQLSLEVHLRYISSIIFQAKQTSRKAQQQKSQYEQLIRLYAEVIRVESVEIVKEGQRLASEFVRVLCQQQQKLRVIKK